jgi:protocatechuate 3,4-dioxygenase beta subunit
MTSTNCRPHAVARLRVVILACIAVLVACNAKQPPAANARAELRAGMPLDLRVRIVTANGEPARNMSARVFHTDAEGYYFKNPDGSEAGGDRARFSVVMRTDADGRFALRTILPARYPTGGPPAHVHLNIPPDNRDSDYTIMLDHDPTLDRERIAKLSRTWVGNVRIEHDIAICDAEITAP